MEYKVRVIKGLEGIAIEEIKSKGVSKIEVLDGELVFESDEELDLKSVIKINRDYVKREYRVKIHGKSINASLAYASVVLSGFKEGEVLLDPLTVDGVVVIEAAMFVKGEVIAASDSIGYLKSSRINSKIAGVDIEFLDCKLGDIDRKVDVIISQLISPSKVVGENTARKLYKIFLEMVDRVLEGRLVVMVNKKELFLEMCGLKLVKEVRTQLGEEVRYILVFEK